MTSENGQTSTAMVTIEDPRHAPMMKRERDRLEFSPEQEAMIRDMYMSSATPLEAAVLLETARARRLDPLKRQIHFVKRWDNEKKRDVWSSQVAIDGFRSIAEATGLYDGQDEPVFELDDEGLVVCAKVRAYRKDIGRPFVGVAFWDEFCQRTKEGDPTKMWRTMPRTMLAKCAESQALRKAFPEELGGLYSTEEMGQAENDTPPVVRQVHPDPEPAPRNAPARPAAPEPDADIVTPLLARLKGADNAMVSAVWADASADANITPKGRNVVRVAAITQWIEIAANLTECDEIARLIKEQKFPDAVDKRMRDALNSKARTLPDEGDDPDDTRQHD